MGNCLVTKLKEVIDNPSLRKLGTFRFYVHAGNASIDISPSVSTGAKATIIGNGYFSNSSYSENKGKVFALVDGNNNLYIKATENCEIEFEVPYGTGVAFDCVKLCYADFNLISKYWKPNKLGIRDDSMKQYAEFDSKNLAYPESLSYLDMTYCPNVHIRLEDLSKCVNAIAFNIFSSDLEGDINAFSNINPFKLGVSLASKVYGSIESLMEAWFAKGVQVSNNAIYVRGTSCTFNGKTVPNMDWHYDITSTGVRIFERDSKEDVATYSGGKWTYIKNY